MEYFLYTYGLGLEPAQINKSLTFQGEPSRREHGASRRERHPVIGRLYTRRQFSTQRRVVHVGVQVGQDRTFRFDPCDPLERLVQIEMARVRLSAKCINDPDLKACERGNAFGRQAFDVGRVGDVTEAEAKGRDVAVVLQ